jgi:large subunit ribosomal protein L10
VIKGGYLDGRALTVAEVNQIADLESREVLLAKMAGAMKANLSKAARLFAEPASQVARLAAALRDKQQPPAEPAEG